MWGGCGSGVEPAYCYLEGRWFDSPGLHVEVSSGQDTEPQTATDVLVSTLHGSQRCAWIKAKVN